MDNADIINIIITIAVILISLVSAIKKEKKKASKRQKNVVEPIPRSGGKSIFDYEIEDEVEEDENEIPQTSIFDEKKSWTPNAEKEKKVSKNNDYYSYETLESENESLETSEQKFTRKESETPIQNTEKEEENDLSKEFNNEELRKAIIYSEILQRPQK